MSVDSWCIPDATRANINLTSLNVYQNKTFAHTSLVLYLKTMQSNKS